MERDKEVDERLIYLSGWRIDDRCCYRDYKKINNSEINKILDYEGNWLCKGKQCSSER